MANVVLDPNTRAPSSPLAGLLRAIVVVPLSGFIAAKLLGFGLTVEAAGVATFISGAINMLGKLLRDKGHAWAQF